LATGETCSRLMKSIAYCEVFDASFWSLMVLPTGYDCGSAKLASS